MIYLPSLILSISASALWRNQAPYIFLHYFIKTRSLTQKFIMLSLKFKSYEESGVLREQNRLVCLFVERQGITNIMVWTVGIFRLNPSSNARDRHTPLPFIHRSWVI